MTSLEASIKREIDFQKKIQEKLEILDYMKAWPDVHAASRLLEEEDVN